MTTSMILLLTLILLAGIVLGYYLWNIRVTKSRYKKRRRTLPGKISPGSYTKLK